MAARGRAEGGLVVSDIEAARSAFAGRGIDATEIWHGSFFSFTDPDGNLWLVQEVTTRRPGRIAGDTGFAPPPARAEPARTRRAVLSTQITGG
jgi:hypothetical protein